MMEKQAPPPQIEAIEPSDILPDESLEELKDEVGELTPSQKRLIIILIVVGVIFTLLLLGATIYLLGHPANAAVVRDVMIIYMGFFMLLNGIVLIILMVQLARLINLLNNEVRPILDSTNEAISNLRGTTQFLSDNLTEPVIKLNQYMAAMTELFKSLGLIRRKPRR